MNILTTEKFIKNAKNKFGDKYNYSKVKCYNANSLIIIICPEHGEFKRTAKSFLRSNYGCPKCNNKTLTTEQFIKKAREIHDDKYDYSKVEYINNHIKVCIICPEHGEFYQTPKNHLKGCGCSKCKSDKISNRFISNTKDFINKYKKLIPEYDYSKVEYKKSNQKIKIICPIHGEFEITPNSLQQGCRCQKCSGRFMDKSYFIECSKKKHDDKYDYSKVEYINNSTKVCIICPEHGEFWQTPKVHLKGGGCPYCKMSHLENNINSILKKEKILFLYESNLNGILKRQTVDFYLPDYNIAIECQGGQHFYGGFNRNNIEVALDIHTKVLNRDIKKYNICKNNNIKILYYTDIKDLPDDIFINKKYKSIYNKNNFFTNKDDLLKEIKKG